MIDSSGSIVRDPDLAINPNKYAPPSGFRTQNGMIRLDGYQAFDLNPDTLDIHIRNESLKQKHALLRKFYKNRFFKGRTILDFGGNNGFFSLRGLASGAISAVVVDLDADPIGNLRELKAMCPHIPINGVRGNVIEWKEPADIVFALALIHWIYNLTTGLGSLDKAIGFLAGLAKDALVIEWVAPEDPVITNYNHTGVKSSHAPEPYSRDEFIIQLEARFETVKSLGNVSGTRELFLAARRSFFQIDRGWEEPLLSIEGSRLVRCRELAPGIWSRVYEGQDKYVKQVSPGIGTTEIECLSKLDHAGIPAVTRMHEGANAVTFSLGKIPGTDLCARAGTPFSPAAIGEIAKGLAGLLQYINDKGIEHRDIQPGNVIWDEHTRSVGLIDFGWATWEGKDKGPLPEFIGFLGNYQGRKNAGAPSDLFAFGSLLLWLLQGRNHPLAWIAMMAISGDFPAGKVYALCQCPIVSMAESLASNKAAVDLLASATGRLSRLLVDALGKANLQHTWLPEADVHTLSAALAKEKVNGNLLRAKNQEMEDRKKILEAEAKTLRKTIKAMKEELTSAKTSHTPSLLSRIKRKVFGG